MDNLNFDQLINMPPAIAESIIKEFFLGISEEEQKEIKAVGEEWLKGQLRQGALDKGLWWQCPEVWRRIAGARRKRRAAGDQAGEGPLSPEEERELLEIENEFKEDPERMMKILNGIEED